MSFLLLLLIFAVCRMLTVLFHELGHALPALAMGSERVVVYVGSYGDPNKSLTFSIGRLHFYLKYNPLLWNQGLCVPNSDGLTVNQQILFTISGPVMSLILGTACFIAAFIGTLHADIRTAFVIFGISAVIDFYTNLIPREDPIKLFDGSLTYNDGHLLRQLWRYRAYAAEYPKAAEFYNRGDYATAADLFHATIRKGATDTMIFRLAIHSYMQAGNDATARELCNTIQSHSNLTSDDFAICAFISSRLGRYEEALDLFEKSLNLDNTNKYALNNRGYTYNLMEQYEKAIADFDRSIEVAPNFAYAYNNRGLAKIKLGSVAEGLKDIEVSLSLDPENAYAYRNRGIYHFDQGEYKLALEDFNRALTIDPQTHLLSEYLRETEVRMGKVTEVQ